uniref:NADH-ubiquinone oxidoreductase chain 3 n=1 Tax=Eolachesilla chilensis TaxID=297977 RepID=A0A8K1ZFF0_9NEOP|nr:NADH dehydrogenase subunit 3 [Eolachesilla chilensis]
MLNIMFSFIIIFMIANIMMLLCILLSKKSVFDREKLSSFECGFDQKCSSRIPFSLRFFLITIIFLIFDVEIVLILPSIINIFFSKTLSWFILNMIFILILIIGVFHEWNQGALDWSD